MTKIIAEIGVDHEGDMRRARKLLRAAVDAHADIVKTQYYAQGLMGPNRILPRLTEDEMVEWCCEADDLGITPLVTPHDKWAVGFIKDFLPCQSYKIGSGGWHLVNLIPRDKKLYISTGMHTPGEVSQMASKLRDRRADSVLLHCISEYPCPPSHAQLHNITTIRQLIHGVENLTVGYSDHTATMHIPLAAVAMGATVIEKHLTLETSQPGRQDTFCSLSPYYFKQFVERVRDIESAMKLDTRYITEGEKQTIEWLKRRERIHKG